MNSRQKARLVSDLARTFGYDASSRVMKACEALDGASQTELDVIADSVREEQREMLELLIAKRTGGTTTTTESDETSRCMSEVSINTLVQVGAAAGFDGILMCSSLAPLRTRRARGTKPFDWSHKQGESSSANTSRTVTYFNSIVPPPDDHEWVDRSRTKGFLTCKVPGTNVVLKGTADVALCTSAAVRNAYEQSGLRIVVKVKPPGETDGILPQLAAVLLGAPCDSSHLKPIGLQTDLVDIWRLMWCAKGVFVAYTCRNRAEAVGILRAFLRGQGAPHAGWHCHRRPYCHRAAAEAARWTGR